MRNGIIFTLLAVLGLALAALPKMCCGADLELGMNGFWGVYQEARITSLGARFQRVGDNTKLGANVQQRMAGAVDYRNYAVYGDYHLDRAYVKTRAAYAGSRDEYAGSADLGYHLKQTYPKVNVLVGYQASYRDNGLHHLAALKFDFPLLPVLIYRYHMRSDLGVSGDRDYEWWQEVAYTVPLKKFNLLWQEIEHQCVITYQLDHQYGFTESELKIEFLFKRG